MFPTISEGLIRLGEAIVTPLVFLKAGATPESLALVLPPRWKVQPVGHFMREGQRGAVAARKLGEGYRLQMFAEAGVTVARAIVIPSREQAAIGRVVVVQGNAVYDRIVVEPNHRRRGLASALMAALGREARTQGGGQGLLVATEDGRGLYESLGWRVLSPYATAVIPA